MKTLKILALLLVLFAYSSKAENEKNVNSTITGVTVFLQGAQITRTAPVNIPTGTSKIIFEGISPYLQTGSIRASGKGNFVIMETRFNIEHVQPGNKKENAVPEHIERRIQQINDSLTELGFEIEGMTLKQTAWTTEKNMLEKNKLIQGQGKADSLQLFMQVMDFYRIKISEINKSLLEVQKELFYANSRKTKMQLRLNELNTYKQQLISENVVPAKYVYQIVILVSSKTATTGSLNVSYFVNNAGWSPSYDLRADNSSGPVNLVYKANIVQSTGEDWDNVDIKLSTMNPNRSNVKPVLSPWRIRYYVQRVAQAIGREATNMTMDVSAADEKKALYKTPAKTTADYTYQTTTMTNVEFNIDMKYSIPSDGKSHLVEVMEYDVPSIYNHFTVPKINQDAYLLARMSGWEDLNLLPGPANIYFSNTFVGTTSIDPNTIEDTLDIALGVDQGISITRKKLKDKDSSQPLATYKEKTVTIEITIYNKKNEAVNITVEDQVPLPGEEEIKVMFDPETVEGESYNKDTGGLTWDITLKPKETKKLTFSYDIKYPRNQKLQ